MPVTMSTSRATDRAGTAGLITGATLRRIRETTGRTQAQLAETLEVDVNTIQSWETGRRPLANAPGRVLQRLRFRMQTLGADIHALRLLDTAARADYLLEEIAETVSPVLHPLAYEVTTRELTNLLSWPLTGVPPTSLRNGTARSLFGQDGQDQLASVLRTAAEASFGDPARGPLLRRQVYFILARHLGSHGWLAEMACQEQRRMPRLDTWTPQWVVARSLAVSRAVAGDRAPLERFLATLNTDTTLTANLNYWAYWIGEVDSTWTSDAHMATTDLGRWRGDRLLTALIGNLDPGVPYVDLCIRSLWSLLLRRPDLADTGTVAALTARIAEHRDAVSTPARRELDQITYAIGWRT
jgi:transcriptional regulator with XRE-family HTH domain